MDLKIIEYGSLASSEIMNNNFSYLDEKIETNSEATNTSISSLLSNIATINTRLNDLAEALADAVDANNLKLDDYKNKTNLLVLENTMVPNWLGCLPIEDLNSYEINKNGYLLLILDDMSDVSILINEVAVLLNPLVSCIPVKNGDVVTCTNEFKKAYFVPATFTAIENF